MTDPAVHGSLLSSQLNITPKHSKKQKDTDIFHLHIGYILIFNKIYVFEKVIPERKDLYTLEVRLTKDDMI